MNAAMKSSLDRLHVSFWRSWLACEGVEDMDALFAWINTRNAETHVEIKRIDLADCAPWFYDEQCGRIHNGSRSFFEIAGMRCIDKAPAGSSGQTVIEQPIILQNEIGYLGILCKEFDGVMHFLMQAKIEPGNINKVQISPTLQATRSNFTQAHGGRRPAFLEEFLNAEGERIVVDQIQSEQSSRFLGKRNRNVMVLTDGDINVPKTHKWMTLGQIKRLMRENNLVNMDTRTVLSCIPWALWGGPPQELYNLCSIDLISSIDSPDICLMQNQAYAVLNDMRMYNWAERQIIRLDEMRDWEIVPDAIRHKEDYPFDVIFCEIVIDGREVRQWTQPLFRARGAAMFGLLSCIEEGSRRFLVKACPEIGCFDTAELGPTVQREAGSSRHPDAVEKQFLSLLEQGEWVTHDVMLSEEGGRFYHEQNRNVLIELDECPAGLKSNNLLKGYLWLDYKTLGSLISCNNNLNIQLRNLLSLLDIRRRQAS